MEDNKKEVRPWDLINPNVERSSEELAKYRFEICKSCEFFKPKTERCSKCGCFMKLKTKIHGAVCPMSKW